MDLWIRSQDKEMLCKVECVELMHDDPQYAKIFLNGKFPDLIVGAYEKKRALEILDEIQNYFKGTPIVKFSRMGDKQYMENIRDLQDNGFILVEDTMDIIPAETKVYEMPKE